MFILLKIECPIIDKNRSAFLPVKLYIYRTHPCKPRCHFCGLAPLGRKSDIEVYMMENNSSILACLTFCNFPIEIKNLNFQRYNVLTSDYSLY